MIYLDFAASTPVIPEVMEAMRPWFTDYYANPSSSHQMGRQAAEAIEKARTTIADEIGAYPSEIIFTSGATESNNLAIKGIALANRDKGCHIITSSIEHKCILAICAYLEKEGFEVTYVDPDQEGVIHPEKVKEALRPDTILVSIHHVNNELGTIQPIEQIGALCLDRGIPFHTDAAQSFGKLDIDVDDLNIDLMSVSGHKIYGPKGVGALYIRNVREAKITPVIHGAGQELGLRGGTMATPLIVGFSSSINISKKHYAKLAKNNNRQIFKESMQGKFDFIVNSNQACMHILNISVPILDTNRLFTYYNNSLSLSKGSACSSLTIEPSHVLKSIGLNSYLSEKSLRISFGIDTNNETIKETVSIISDSCNFF
ncbi:cysteine desulfurase family protein [Endozoicomonas sp. ISHI1]|uniref:cysteine desulfurase family protein n=1 Tax=Endozoicomonas sp. ISHI1 TaxID=2825882 RepID=UPI002147333A|nr:cysteine desulfurase family protein [Endozoicomonas sp. ISHI1]